MTKGKRMIDPTQLDFAPPDGTALADATGERIRNVADWLNAVVDQLRPEQTPANWMTGTREPHGRAAWRPEPQPPIDWRSRPFCGAAGSTTTQCR